MSMLPLPSPTAVLFDMDGTLVDNMRFHVQAWVALARSLGLDAAAAPEERFEREFAGKRNEEILSALLGRSMAPEEATRLADQKEAHYRELYRPHLVPLRGALELLARLRQVGRGSRWPRPRPRPTGTSCSMGSRCAPSSRASSAPRT